MVYASVCALIALALGLAVGGPTVSYLRAKKLGKAYSGEEPEAYATKAGTPTLGGIIFLFPLLVVALPTSVSRDIDVALPLLAMTSAAALGAVDDFQTLVGREKLSGHEPWFWGVKWAALFGIGILVAAWLYFRLDYRDAVLPHFGAFSLGAFYLPVTVLVFVVATSGAVITDGMDGLMAGVSLIAYVAYALIAFHQQQDALGAFALTTVGATAAFLWFNAYPARVFLGEVGAHALAVGLIVLAFMTGWWLLLPIIAVVYFAEGLSDVIQIGYFKASNGKRFFRMAPIHYHFQLGGWAETQVVFRFWIVGLAGALAGVALVLTD
jgi:phospho-N-acetylmuramoyl-pentapeptide-transferase